MRPDAAELRAFYYRTRLGRAAQAALRDSIARLWPDVAGMNVAGFGFAGPFLRPFLASAARVSNFMPAQQGAVIWPPEGPNLSALVEERNWPVNAGFFDRILVVHALECSDHIPGLLEEINRCLAPGGRAIFIAANRSGLWARRDATPFGHGRPYSLSQLQRELRAHGFEPEAEAAALYAPPSQRNFWLRSAPAIERFGQSALPERMAGVVMADSVKLTFAAPRGGVGAPARGRLEALEELAGARPSTAPSALAPGARAAYKP